MAILIEPVVSAGGTIASEGKGEPLYVEGRVLDIHGKVVPNAAIETWEADADGTALFGILHPRY